MTKPHWRLPAEWAPQSAVLLAWPHAGTDWAERLASVETTYAALVKAITRFEPVLLAVASPEIRAHASALLSAEAVDLNAVHWVPADYDDTWLRDSGPITLRSTDGDSCLLDFRFTGWGGKFEAGRDDALVEQLRAAGVFGAAQHERIDFALEGGAIDVDGEGSLLSTWHCLHERHPDASREAIETTLLGSLRQDRLLWLEHGYLEGDDTDAHIDTLARFASPTRIVYQACDDPGDSHYAELRAMGEELANLRTTAGQPYELFALPWAKPILDEGRRLAASYANFLIINGAVLMPAYGDPADIKAAEVLARAFPDREVVPVPCRPLIWQNGSLHCISMQLPEGVLHVE
ncbi:MAG: agmatine deiminase family protein [Rhodanobacteraceae bacterium]|nr:agmatine deiminase family protein [Xanthomonadales bacterium]MCP5478346.1 agmatine deiminase family protein [Rhodanobacteraceae bacterium]HPF73623.1 agmatine deiminase family protein [Xanthomonadaceae bacterium]HRX99350.1 agmatine deiminase family protein [Xanthomonadaceae bacterium]